MTIILGFVFPILLFLVTIPLKAAMKVAQASISNTLGKSSVMDKLNESSDVKATKKVVNVAKKAAIYAAKRLIRMIKFIIGLIKSVILVIQTLVALGMIGLILAIAMLIAAAAGAVLFMMMVKSDVESGTSVNIGSNIGGSSISQGVAYDKWFWVGDSRTVGLALTMGESVTHGSGGSTAVITDTYCARGSMGIAWFNTEGKDDNGVDMTAQREKIFAMTGTNIVFNLGVNGLDVDNYTTFYKSLPEDFIKNNNVIVMSVNPVNEEKEKAKGYTITNESIEAFNATVKAALPAGVTYLDIYSQIVDDVKSGNLISDDGLHYTEDGYKKIYELVTSSFTASNTGATEASTEATTTATTTKAN